MAKLRDRAARNTPVASRVASPEPAALAEREAEQNTRVSAAATPLMSALQRRVFAAEYKDGQTPASPAASKITELENLYPDLSGSHLPVPSSPVRKAPAAAAAAPATPDAQAKAVKTPAKKAPEAPVTQGAGTAAFDLSSTKNTQFTFSTPTTAKYGPEILQKMHASAAAIRAQQPPTTPTSKTASDIIFATTAKPVRKRFDDAHDKQFSKMPSIANHYAAKRTSSPVKTPQNPQKGIKRTKSVAELQEQEEDPSPSPKKKAEAPKQTGGAKRVKLNEPPQTERRPSRIPATPSRTSATPLRRSTRRSIAPATTSRIPTTRRPAPVAQKALIPLSRTEEPSTDDDPFSQENPFSRSSKPRKRGINDKNGGPKATEPEEKAAEPEEKATEPEEKAAEPEEKAANPEEKVAKSVTPKPKATESEELEFKTESAVPKAHTIVETEKSVELKAARWEETKPRTAFEKLDDKVLMPGEEPAPRSVKQVSESLSKIASPRPKQVADALSRLPTTPGRSPSKLAPSKPSKLPTAPHTVAAPKFSLSPAKFLSPKKAPATAIKAARPGNFTFTTEGASSINERLRKASESFSKEQPKVIHSGPVDDPFAPFSKRTGPSTLAASKKRKSVHVASPATDDMKEPKAVPPIPAVPVTEAKPLEDPFISKPADAQSQARTLAKPVKSILKPAATTTKKKVAITTDMPMSYPKFPATPAEKQDPTKVPVTETKPLPDPFVERSAPTAPARAMATPKQSIIRRKAFRTPSPDPMDVSRTPVMSPTKSTGPMPGEYDLPMDVAESTAAETTDGEHRGMDVDFSTAEDTDSMAVDTQAPPKSTGKKRKAAASVDVDDTTPIAYPTLPAISAPGTFFGETEDKSEAERTERPHKKARPDAKGEESTSDTDGDKRMKEQPTTPNRRAGLFQRGKTAIANRIAQLAQPKRKVQRKPNLPKPKGIAKKPAWR